MVPTQDLFDKQVFENIQHSAKVLTTSMQVC